MDIRKLGRSAGVAVGVLVAGWSSAACDGTRAQQVPLAPHAVLARAVAPSQDSATSEVRQVFAEWAQAHARGDEATLQNLYDTGRFEGVRWTRSGFEKRLSWADWCAEQRPLLRARAVSGQGPALVAAPVFESWPGGTLDAATASVTFQEEGAAPRVLVFGRSGDGHLRVLREEIGGPPARGLAQAPNTLARDAKVVRALSVTSSAGPALE